ncbi:hypothetical protein Nmel_015367, partial [Mimus melanotis]
MNQHRICITGPKICKIQAEQGENLCEWIPGR